ncbi:E3 ubiquitin-protein ligase RING1-like [Solanum dulcamara]|uniref:E3 ubiquitin-protein ligase RING1-like n=1 Tax=Solanum dulcamara TaxID=45834 RepID=UPI002486AF32|nr:E3 ubiquitin-protein ligase RING1-like [Solanum dulcamara]
MAGAPMPYTPPYSPPKHSNLLSLYCALIIVGTAVFLLGLYNFIITRWCSENNHTNQSHEQNSIQIPNNLNVNIVSSFRYKKKELGGIHQEKNNEYECAVCLSVLEEGEEVKQLPICKHSFHASCIDMWLYSHLDCPLCRSPVEPLVLHQNSFTRQEESSRDGLIVQDSSV